MKLVDRLGIAKLFGRPQKDSFREINPEELYTVCTESMRKILGQVEDPTSIAYCLDQVIRPVKDSTISMSTMIFSDLMTIAMVPNVTQKEIAPERLKRVMLDVARYITYGLANPTPECSDLSDIIPTERSKVLTSGIFHELGKELPEIATAIVNNGVAR